MVYVVKIRFDRHKPDYKVFEKSGDARARHMLAFGYGRSKELFHLDDESTAIVTDCDTYKVDTSDVRDAVRLVKSGKVDPLIWPLFGGVPGKYTWELLFDWNQQEKSRKKKLRAPRKDT